MMETTATGGFLLIKNQMIHVIFYQKYPVIKLQLNLKMLGLVLLQLHMYMCMYMIVHT